MQSKLLTLLVCLLSLNLFGCATSNHNPNNPQVGMVVYISGIDDKSYNQKSYEGAMKYLADEGISKNNFEFTNSANHEQAVDYLSYYSDQKKDLIICPGQTLVDSVTIVAAKYPDQKYVVLDGIVPLDNVSSIMFANNEGAYLVGVAAALKAKDINSDTVGFLGGIDEPLIHGFEAGFKEGVIAIDPKLNILIEYTNDYNNPTKGQQMAAEMFDEGASIIFNVTGASGNGLIDEAKSRANNGEDVYVIGVDKDQYDEGIYNGKDSVILTSMIKKCDVAVYNTLENVQNDSFVGGIQKYSLSNDGVGIPEENPNLKDVWVEKLNFYKKEIVNGNIVVPNTK